MNETVVKRKVKVKVAILSNQTETDILADVIDALHVLARAHAGLEWQLLEVQTEEIKNVVSEEDAKREGRVLGKRNETNSKVASSHCFHLTGLKVGCQPEEEQELPGKPRFPSPFSPTEHALQINEVRC
jgi:hypothetical protein